MLLVAKGLSHGYVWLRCWVNFVLVLRRTQIVVLSGFLFILLCTYFLVASLRYGWRLDSSSLDSELELGEFAGFYIFSGAVGMHMHAPKF